jgi:hypothetical protein
MIAEHLNALDSHDPLHLGRPGLVDHTMEMTSCDSVFDDNKSDSGSRFLTWLTISERKPSLSTDFACIGL